MTDATDLDADVPRLPRVRRLQESMFDRVVEEAWLVAERWDRLSNEEKRGSGRSEPPEVRYPPSPSEGEELTSDQLVKLQNVYDLRKIWGKGGPCHKKTGYYFLFDMTHKEKFGPHRNSKRGVLWVQRIAEPEPYNESDES